MGHSLAVHERSYRQITEAIKARAFESDADTIPLMTPPLVSSVGKLDDDPDQWC